MRIRMLALLAALFVFQASLALSGERTTLFDGLDMRLVSWVDSMTDQEHCAIFADSGPIYIGLYEHNDLAIWPGSDKTAFASDGSHLIRVGQSKPYQIVRMSKGDGLRLELEAETTSVVNALLTGERVRLRYSKWPSYDNIDQELKLPNLYYVYNMAVEQCGWRDLQLHEEFGPAELDIYRAEDGYARIKVVGNNELVLAKGFDKYGGGCHIALGGVNEILGMKHGKWTIEGFIGSSDKIIIRDMEGNELLSEVISQAMKRGSRGEQYWPRGQRVARVAWEVAPNGSIEFTGGLLDRGRIYLFGLRELWNWGVDNCGFPSFAEE